MGLTALAMRREGLSLGFALRVRGMRRWATGLGLVLPAWGMNRRASGMGLTPPVLETRGGALDPGPGSWQQRVLLLPHMPHK